MQRLGRGLPPFRKKMFDLLYVSLLSTIICVGEVAFKLDTIQQQKKLDNESM
jgi:hypothetical protein